MNVRSLLSRTALIFFGFAVAAGLQAVSAQHADAQTTDTSTSSIQAEIDAHNQQIADLEKEIAGYQSQLNTLGTQHQTLQTAISSIDVSRQQTSAQISVTQNKLAATNLQLQKLSGQISDTQYQIQLDKQSVAESLRDMQANDETNVIEQVLSAGTLADAWTNADAIGAVNQALQANVATLSGVTQQLAGEQDDVSKNKDQLSTLSTQLGTQEHQLDVNKAAKNSLLTQTKNQESSYQSLITQKKAQEKSFEAELQTLQSQLKSVGQASIPTVGSGILAWPVSPTFMASCASKASALGNPYCITQYFGNTPFATANPSVYNGMGHDGLDIGMPIGTPVQAALAGTVLGTGDTDLYRSPTTGAQCYSFGNWVMIKHANGLDTLYAHLSQIGVSTGQTVATGQVIGYSGMTGYATGPHLHFGVYAGAGVQIMDLGKFRGSGGTPCTDGGAILPVAPNNAYLNPMSYLL